MVITFDYFLVDNIQNIQYSYEDNQNQPFGGNGLCWQSLLYGQEHPMLFSSITFLILFLPLVLLVYYYCPAIKAKNCFLLLASLVFYAWGEPKYVLVMLLSIAINYRMGLWIGEISYTPSGRRIILTIAITANLLLLFYFKYLGFSERSLTKYLEFKFRL